VIDEIVSKDARLEIATRKANKLPRVFEIHDLIMRGFGLPEGAAFQAGITNAIPRGRIETTGVFGPWLTEEPTLTPIRGEYSFRNANLNDIKGIAGILSSVGQYRGTLERIEVDGQTETPDFSIDLAESTGAAVHALQGHRGRHNGDTWLDRVDAKLGQSNIIASGAVVRERDVKGRHVALDIQIRDARIEDILRLGGQGGEGADDRTHGVDDNVPAAGGRAGCHRSLESEWTIPSRAGALQQHRRAAAH
jgi:hypothetical protein